jgi:hypothetical protein
MRIGHVGQEIAQGINVEGASRVIGNRLIARTKVLNNRNQENPKSKISFLVAEEGAVVCARPLRTTKGPVDRIFHSDSRGSQKSHFGSQF